MKYLLLLLALALPLHSGCIASSVQEAIDAADARVREKWAEEWKPALVAEIRNGVEDGKDQALEEMISRLEAYDADVQEKFDRIGVDVRSHDVDGNGKMDVTETLALLKDIKEKNNGNYDWWEIMLLVAGAYLPSTGLKEWLVKKKKSVEA